MAPLLKQSYPVKARIKSRRSANPVLARSTVQRIARLPFNWPKIFFGRRFVSLTFAPIFISVGGIHAAPAPGSILHPQTPELAVRALRSVDALGDLDSGYELASSSAEPDSQKTSTPSTPTPTIVPRTPTGKQLSGAVQDEGGQTFNVKAFGAKGDGVTDDLEAIKGAIAAAAHVGGGTILFPQGTYRTSGEVAILSSWIHLSGVGVGVSVLQCDSGVMKAIKFGDKGTTPRTHHGVNYCSVSKLNVVRAPGPIPVNSVGIAWECFTKSGEQDVIVRNHYYDRSFEGGEGGISIGWRGVNCYAGNATGAYVWLNGAAGVTFSGAYFGYGSEVVYPVYCIEISGTANDINFTDATVIPDGPTRHDIFGFTHYTGVGVISLINFNTEHARYGFVSDAASPVITELKIVGGRWICGTDVFHLHPATHLANFSLTSGASIGGPFNLPPSCVWTRIQGCFFGSAVTLNGGLIPNSRGKLADLAFTGNTCAGNLSAIGDWDALAVDGNVVRGNINNAASGSVSFGSNAKVQRRDAR